MAGSLLSAFEHQHPRHNTQRDSGAQQRVRRPSQPVRSTMLSRLNLIKVMAARHASEPGRNDATSDWSGHNMVVALEMSVTSALFLNGRPASALIPDITYAWL